MSHNLSLFSDYRARENHTTNYCGVILKLLYQDNPQAFSDVLSRITEAKVDIGVRFSQQEVGPTGVPDLVIRQDAVEVLFEAKNAPPFKARQLIGHLASFQTRGTRVLLAISRFEKDDYDTAFLEQHKEAVDQAQKLGIAIRAVSFDAFLEAINSATVSTSMKEYVSDFTTYLERNKCLSRWKTLLTCVNVAQSFDEFLRGAYICPFGPSAFTHRSTRYLGAYRNKTVSRIAEVLGVVAFPFNDKLPEIIEDRSGNPEQLKEMAITFLKQSSQARIDEANNIPLKVFVLQGERYETDFRKDSPGGLMAAKIYFDDIATRVGANNAEELSEKLRGRVWSEFRQVVPRIDQA